MILFNFKGTSEPLKSLWVFLVCDFSGAIVGTLSYLFLTDFLLEKNHVLYDLEEAKPTVDEKQRLI